ncbi:TPA: hypothetical protein HA361_00345 [Candidatus Woesearchaeota archaeon]|nr:hypothetical protein [Candidatus Woesearchaeota archaeon]HII69383.1 hypothetical protein [Candidatus Woesearchaeota archaeon]
MKSKILTLGLFILALAGSVFADQYLALQLDYDGERFVSNNIELKEGDYSFPMNSIQGYRLSIVNLENSEIYSLMFNFIDSMKSTSSFMLPYYPDAKMLKITDASGNTAFTYDLSSYANPCGDRVCRSYENYLSCPQDCPKGFADSYCDAEKDAVCDPDCPEGSDQDCSEEQDTVILIISLMMVVIIIIFLAIALSKSHEKLRSEVSKIQGFIRHNVRKGYTKDQIKEHLKKHGLQQKKIDRALKDL